ncbi:hypothetical protein GPJ56_001484 [Histomonas meleagridis]|uniref:uncharacterized protein n=1 Tax=Histomonas meleagridis TaxID=135588 RepID=UPI00355A8F77|nr:hypothetical protein GPJ56_001484 [Histomonas meleagridis]KAH0806990.1 hypothetical protein GO595_000166 [Histomonas meleagridis]
MQMPVKEPSPQMLQFNELVQNFKKLFNESQNEEEVNTSLNQVINAILEMKNVDDDFVVSSEIIQFILMASSNTSEIIRSNLHKLLYYVVARSIAANSIFLHNDPADFILALINSPIQTDVKVGFLLIRDLAKSSKEGVQYLLSRNFLDLCLNYAYHILETSTSDPQNLFAILHYILLSIPTFYEIDSYSNYVVAITDLSAKIIQINISFSVIEIVLRILIILAQKKHYTLVISSNCFSLAMSLFNSPEAFDSLQNYLVLLASAMLYSSGKDEVGDVLSMIPINILVNLFDNFDPSKLKLFYLLTFFVNYVSLGEQNVAVLSTPERLDKLFSYLENPIEQSFKIQQSVIWCLWNMLRFGSLESIFAILNHQSIDSLVDITFDSDDMDFIKKILIPSLLDFIPKVEKEMPEMPEIITNTIQERLVDLCYREDSPEIESLAASCLKRVFPERYETEGFC